MKRNKYVLIATLLVLSSCSGLESSIPDVSPEDAAAYVVFEAPVITMGGMDGETKASLLPSDDNIDFAWEKTDTVGIYPDKGSQVFFSMENGEGTNTAVFDGGGWSLRKSSKYYSYFPFVGDIYLDSKEVPVSFLGQEQTGLTTFNNSTAYLVSEGMSSADGALHFNFEMVNTVIRVDATLPAGTYTRATLSVDEPLFVSNGTYNLATKEISGKEFSKTLSIDLLNCALSERSVLSVFFASAPVDLRGKRVLVRFYSDDGKAYGCTKNPSYEYVAGAWFGLNCTMGEIRGNIQFADSEVKEYCVSNYDTDDDGELSYEEAEAVTDLQSIPMFQSIVSFNELRFFTGLTKIKEYCFASSQVSSIILPESVTVIEIMAFEGSSLESITISASVLKFGQYAFRGCKLAEIIVSADNPVYDSRDNCNAIIETASNTLLVGCNNSIIPDSVTSIGDAAFECCSALTSVTIPDSVTSIGASAFLECSALSSITIYALTPPTLSDSPFKTDYYTLYSGPIYVPAGSVESYKNTNYWSDYAAQIQSIQSGTGPDIPGGGVD